MELIGLFGHPVGHSLSKTMHTAAIKALGIPWEYKLFDIHPSKLSLAIEGIRLFGLRGVNVTVPHKTAVMPYLDKISDTARLCGAVNTIVNVDGILSGHNRDFGGFMEALKYHGFETKGKKILVFGAGGSARAIVSALSSLEASVIYLSNRTLKKAQTLAEGLTNVFPVDFDNKTIDSYIRSVDAIINTTSLGMYPKIVENPLDGIHFIPENLFVFDLIYNPWQTVFLQKARIAGCKTANGAEMLVRQGALSFKLWTGRDAPVDIMRNALALEGKI